MDFKFRKEKLVVIGKGSTWIGADGNVRQAFLLGLLLFLT